MGCSQSVGWNGYCLVAGNTLPFITGGFSRTLDILESESLYVDSKPFQYNYSTGKDISKGKLSTEVFTTGTYGTALSTLIGLACRGNKCAILGAGSGGASLKFSPNGAQEQTVGKKAVINGMSLRGNPAGNVLCDFQITATDITTTTSVDSASIVAEAISNSDDGNPLPYYSSSLTVTGTLDDTLISNYLMDWSLDVSCDVTPVFTFCEGVTTPNDLRVGVLRVSGSFVYYNPAGIYATQLTEAGIVIDLVLGRITLPKAIFTNDSVMNDGQNNPVFRRVDFKAFGSNGSNSISFT